MSPQLCKKKLCAYVNKIVVNNFQRGPGNLVGPWKQLLVNWYITPRQRPNRQDRTTRQTGRLERKKRDVIRS